MEMPFLARPLGCTGVSSRHTYVRLRCLRKHQFGCLGYIGHTCLETPPSQAALSRLLQRRNTSLTNAYLEMPVSYLDRDTGHPDRFLVALLTSSNGREVPSSSPVIPASGALRFERRTAPLNPSQNSVNLHYRPVTCASKIFIYLFIWGTRLRHCARSRKVAGSITDGVTGIFH
jgi:hypothetical protein